VTLRNLGLVYRKEMRDTLRDKRTLFVSLILPIVLYPVLMIGLTQVMMMAERGIRSRAQKVAVTGADADARDRVLASIVEGGGVEIVDPPDADAALGAREIDAFVEVPEGFGEAIAGRDQGLLRLHFDSTRDDSKAAERKLRQALAGLGKQVLRERGISEADIEPVKVEAKDQAVPRQQGAKQFGPMLALLLVIMALSGAFYPAVDTMAGEKERGTMETLLVCPASRTEIVLGKYLMVLTMTLLTALLNFASMSITFSHFAGMMPATSGGSLSLEVSPAVGFAIIAALLPLAALFSAVALALSAFARTYKEGQYYLTPIFLTVMPLSMVAMVPGTKLATFAAVPVSGAVLLVRDLLLEQAGLGHLLVVFASTGACAALALWATISMFNREDVLFRDPAGTGFGLFRRARAAGEVPRAGQALLLAAAVLAGVFFLQPLFARSPRGGFLLQFLGLFLAAPVLGAVALRVDLRKTFSLRLPPPGAWPAALLGAPALLVVVGTLVSLLGFDEESLRPLEKSLSEFVARVGLPMVVLLPPIVEEVLFRGFLLSALRRSGKAARAVVLTAAIFAFFHLMPMKYLPTGLIGLWLGYLVVATGSLYPAILAHLANNAVPLLFGEELAIPALAAVPALVAFAGCVLWLERLRRRRSAGESLPPAAPPG
jgi:sodium transport system permease protein